MAAVLASVLVAAVLLSVLGGGAAGQSAASVDGTATEAFAAGGQALTGPGGQNETKRRTAGETKRITLITGDVVEVHGTGENRTYSVMGDGNATISDSPAGTYVVPAGVNLSKFDDNLFNVDLLLSQNVSDGDSASIPVIVRWSGEGTNYTRAMDRAGVEHHRSLESIDATAVRVRKSGSWDAYRTLASNSNVREVYYDAQVRATETPTREAVAAPQARSRFGVSGEGVTVAILDSGVNESHPDLREAERLERDFTGEGTTSDLADHGTGVAGLVAGDGTASNGTVVGVAPDADVLDVRVLDRFGDGRVSAVVDGIEFALERDADVISMSLGARPAVIRSLDPFSGAVRAATSRNVSVVAAAGNDGRTVTTPGTLAAAITVGASADESRVPAFSNSGPTAVGKFLKPDLVAPGVGVRSTANDGAGYRAYDGTSFSTPFVSGTVALLREAYPDWTDERIKSVVTGTADPLPSGDEYAQGAGELNATAALDAGIVVDPGTIDFGRVPVETTQTRTVDVTNVNSEAKRVNISASVTEPAIGDPGGITVNRSAATIDPGESVTVALRIDTSGAALRPQSGRLQVGSATAIFGYAPQQTIEVEKRGLGSVAGDTVTLVHEETGRVFGPTAFEEATATVRVDRRGRYVAVSPGRHDGTPVLTANRTTADGPTTFVLDESRTVTRTIDTRTLPHAGGELHNRTVVLSAVLDVGPVDERIVVDDPPTAAVRVSPTSVMSYAVRRVVAASPQGPIYDAPTLYHLKHEPDEVSRSAAVAVDVDALDRQEVRYYRGRPGETFSATLADDDFGDVALFREFTPAGIGTRFEQTIHVSPSIAQYHDAFATDSFGFVVWTATPEDVLVDFGPDGVATTAVKRHPFRSKLSRWSLSNARFSAAVFPTVGQPPNGYVISDTPPERYDLWVNGERVRSETRNVVEAFLTAPGPDIDSVRLRVRDRHGLSPLSNRTVTTFRATTKESDTRPPTVPSVTFESHGPTNVVPNGSVRTVVSTIDRDSSIRNVTLFVAKRDDGGAPATVPFSDESGWRRVNLTRVDDGRYAATIEIGAYRGTLSIGARAVDGAGNAVATSTTDAVVVGSRIPTANVAANRTLVETGEPIRFDAGASFDDLGIATYRWDFDGDGTVDEMTESATITHSYRQAGPVTPSLTVADEDRFENTTAGAEIAVARALPPQLDGLDEGTVADIRRAARAERTVIMSDRLDGKERIGPNSTFITRADANGGFDGGAGSTVAALEADVNGNLDGHNVVLLSSTVNGGVDATGAVTALSGGTVTVNGDVEPATIWVVSNGSLAVRGSIRAGTVVLGGNATLEITGDLQADVVEGRDGGSLRVGGSLGCAESRLPASVDVTIHGRTDCPGIDGRSDGRTSEDRGARR